MGILFLVIKENNMHLLLLEKIYGSKSAQITALRSAQDILKREVGSLRLNRLEPSIGNAGYLQVSMDGVDYEGAKQYLKWKYGTTINFNELVVGDKRRGHLVSPNKVGFGNFVDIGIVNPRKEALLPLYRLRDQLPNGKALSMSQIIRIYGFVENFPVDTIVTSIDQDKGTINIELAKTSLELFNQWYFDRLERIICCGTSRREIKRALIKAGAGEDFKKIERLGLMENAIACLYGINASHLIQRIGPYLPAVSLSVFHTPKIRQLIYPTD